jgi:hypothetical protein
MKKEKIMWEKTHSVTVQDLKPAQVWKVWSDISKRTEWDLDMEWMELKGPFEKGAVLHFKPKGGKKLSMQITECIPNQCFTDCFKMPFARMRGIHQMEETPQGLKISTTMKVEGPLGWILRKFVAEKVVAELPLQTAMLIKLARKQKV